MLVVELVRQTSAEQVVRRFALRPSWAHRKSPEIAAPNRASGSLQYSSHGKKPLSLNGLPIFQRLLATFRRKMPFAVSDDHQAISVGNSSSAHRYIGVSKQD